MDRFAGYGLTIIIHGYFEPQAAGKDDNEDSDVHLKFDMPIINRVHVEENNPALQKSFKVFDEMVEAAFKESGE